ncbi:DUF6385 domain-containing protein [Cellulomonas timonensis]|uniref:DUF6385 domain-containing protein n=1 Tax=Cellulomonas timonensis TaxID=1689271 RepID=UPI00082C298E|nr:DUF6385 domain-containing protein [Cellulomonas timonensis]
MQTTNTSVIARRVKISDDYATLPYEAGWASEAVTFIQAEGDHPDLAIAVEVSPDGINWVRRTGATLSASQQIVDLPLAQFGNWLRVVITGATSEQPARVLVHLNLKG